jgi:hypothetical protein
MRVLKEEFIQDWSEAMDGSNSLFNLMVEQLGLPREFAEKKLNELIKSTGRSAADLNLSDLREIAAELLNEIILETEDGQLSPLNNNLN